MPGNHGSSNRELIALPGCEEETTAESEWTESSHFIILVSFFGFGVGFFGGFGFVWLVFLILTVSITLIKILQEKLPGKLLSNEKPNCCFKEAARYWCFCQNVIPHPSAALYILLSVSS